MLRMLMRMHTRSVNDSVRNVADGHLQKEVHLFMPSG